MKTKPHAKVLAEAERIVDGEFTDPLLTRHALAYFESRCLDWLAKRAYIQLEHYNDKWVFRTSPHCISHKLRHVAIARAVLAVHKQETAK